MEFLKKISNDCRLICSSELTPLKVKTFFFVRKQNKKNAISVFDAGRDCFLFFRVANMITEKKFVSSCLAAFIKA